MTPRFDESRVLQPEKQLRVDRRSKTGWCRWATSGRGQRPAFYWHDEPILVSHLNRPLRIIVFLVCCPVLVLATNWLKRLQDKGRGSCEKCAKGCHKVEGCSGGDFSGVYGGSSWWIRLVTVSSCCSAVFVVTFGSFGGLAPWPLRCHRHRFWPWFQCHLHLKIKLRTDSTPRPGVTEASTSAAAPRLLYLPMRHRALLASHQCE